MEAEEERNSCLIDGKPQGARGLARRGRFHMVNSDDCTFLELCGIARFVSLCADGDGNEGRVAYK